MEGGYLWQTFENISGHQPVWMRRGRRWLRGIADFLESVPGLRYSHLMAMLRQAVSNVVHGPVEFDEQSGHYKFGEIDWAEFKDVLAGNGPCNEQRLAKRQKAQDDGAWVREAARAYALKHAARKAA